MEIRQHMVQAKIDSAGDASDAGRGSGRFRLGMGCFGPYAPVAYLYLIGLLLLSLSRIALVLWQSERVFAAGVWTDILIQGVRVDVIQLGLLAVPLLLVLPLLGNRVGWRAWRMFSFLWVVAAIVLLAFLEVATPGFILEYDTRPDRLFIEYLKYPDEVATMLWTGFRWHVVAGVLLTVAVAALVVRAMRPWLAQPPVWSVVRVLLVWPLVVVLVALGVRSSLDHRPANPAMFAITSDGLVNALILNSTWSVAHAIYGLKNENRSSEIYGRLTNAEIMQEVETVRATHAVLRETAGSQALPTLTHQAPVQGEARRLNLVIILEESLGATFVESLGGVGVTPELEKLKHQGWWFERLFATGTRSVRGIEAVLSGFPPTPAQSVVKLSLAQKGFFTLASLLGTQGYFSEFIYGGESHFDNMRGFFLGNGFDSVIDQNDYKDPVFQGNWGVSDEDLFDMTHARLEARHAAGQPSFTFVFTSSNHSPFEFPDGRIELHDPDKATENNAVKYADYALGRFFERARNSAYWQDTVFLIVADHDIRVRGDSLVPVERFHIPGLILGAGIEARRIGTVASQIDLAPTLLSLIGVEVDHPMIGRDLTREPDGLPGRAMMQYQDHYAWMEGDEVVVLRPEKAPTHARYDFERKRLETAEAPVAEAGIEQRALAHVLLPAWLYREQRYRLPDLPQRITALPADVR